jgi:hypothetical protein
MNTADEPSKQRADTIDDLAAFLMHRTYDRAVTDADRLQIFAAVQAYQEGDDPPAIEAVMRNLALRFRGHLDYQPEWRPQPKPPTWAVARDGWRAGQHSVAWLYALLGTAASLARNSTGIKPVVLGLACSALPVGDPGEKLP